MNIKWSDPIGAHRNAGLPVQGEEWSKQEFVGDDLAGVIFQDCRFSGVHFREADLTQANFVECQIDDSLFDSCKIRQTTFVKCTGSGLRVAGTSAEVLVFAACNFSEVALGEKTMHSVVTESSIERLALDGPGVEQYGLTVSGSELGQFFLENARWSQCSAVEVDLSAWAYTNAHFDSCSFVKVKAPGADLRDVRFHRCNLYRSQLEGTKFHNAEGSIFSECEMREAEFVGASLTGALFSKVKADESRFDRAVLDNAMFPGASLVGAQFPGIHAHVSVWTDANLEGANLENADCYQSVFRNAILKDASVVGASFRECDLHGVEDSLAGADLTGSRESVAWRQESESFARRPPTGEPTGGSASIEIQPPV